MINNINIILNIIMISIFNITHEHKFVGITYIYRFVGIIHRDMFVGITHGYRYVDIIHDLYL